MNNHIFKYTFLLAVTLTLNSGAFGQANQSASATGSSYSRFGLLKPVALQEAQQYDALKNKIKNTNNRTDIENLYFNTEKGPYFNNKWYKAEVVTADDKVVEENFELRFDTYQHTLHYKDKKGNVKTLQTIYIKGFKLYDEAESHVFVKIYPGINEYAPPFSFYEVLYNGDYKLYRLIYESLEISNYMGPGSDGRSRAMFMNHDFLYLRDRDNFYKKVSFRKKVIRNLFKDDLEKLKTYERQEGRVNSQKDLIAFLNYIDSK